MPNGETNPFRILGAFAPSSKRLALAMTRFINSDGARILEVGAGSGAITRAIVAMMQPYQSCDVVEYFPQLGKYLKHQFRKNSSVEVFCGDILDFDLPPDSYDFIVCSLPFNAFTPETTSAIVTRLLDLAKNNAIMSFFEYRILQDIAKTILPNNKREEFLGSRALIDTLCDRYQFQEAKVNLNIPPAIVHYLRIDKTGERPCAFWRV